jgi:hypothetical protein
MAVEIAVLELDACALGGLRDEAHLDLAGPLEVGLELPLRADVPAEDNSVWRLDRQHPGPLALAAVDAAVVHPAADVRLEYRLGDFGRQHVVVARLDPIEVLRKDAERSLDRRLDHDREADARRGRLSVSAHSFSSVDCSTATL